MALEAYRKKRDFAATSEPKGGPERPAGAAAPGELSFVVQKHAARRLHYDLRLEFGGVLWSWAVTRGPSLAPHEKRLAVRTEDHPLEYGEFEGTIPKKEYGGGTVLVWDRGAWKPVHDAKRGQAKGHLEFELDGERLRGRWHLVRMAQKPRDKRENWLLIKAEDGFARTEDAPDILEEHADSVKTGRSIAEIGREAPGWSAKTGRTVHQRGAQHPRIKAARKRPHPGFVSPALATLRTDAPTGDRWIHEIKFDGYRLQAHLRQGEAALLTRTGLDWTGRFGPRVAAALAALPAGEAIIDGELVVETPGGASDFSILQADLSDGRTDRFVFYAFDLLYLDGLDLREAALGDRKDALEALIRGAADPLRYSGHFDEEGEVILRHACRLSLEGVVSKLRDGKYRSGRGKGWIKSKCLQRQEFVVLGFMPSSTSRKAIGSLLLGHHDAQGKLIPAGRVGAGFSQRVAEDLFARLDRLTRAEPAFSGPLDAASRRELRFVAPELVAEVEFSNWTADGSLRHSVFRGLREDKPAQDVVREDHAARGKGGARPVSAVKLTHPDRLYWKDAGVTKEGLASYYTQVWPRIAPHVVARPLALLRCPQDIAGPCFFQKHAWRGQSKDILTARDPRDTSDDSSITAIDGLDGLIGLVQGAALEIHGWQSQLNDLERPDQMVMDLDPGEGVSWTEVIDAAQEVRDRLRQAGLASFVKTSGGKGLHVVAPLRPEAGWEAVKAFAKAVADAMAADSPERFVATMAKARRRGKILIDYLRNGRGSTAVAPYSTRAREGAPVSMPLGWDELDPGVGPAYFTVLNAPTRLAGLTADPWGEFRAAAEPIAGKAGKAPRCKRSAPERKSRQAAGSPGASGG